jgi:hypothetical protein
MADHRRYSSARALSAVIASALWHDQECQAIVEHHGINLALHSAAVINRASAMASRYCGARRHIAHDF